MSFIIQEQATPVLFEIGKEEATGAGGTIDFYLAEQDKTKQGLLDLNVPIFSGL